MAKFEFDLDEHFDDLWHELERVQDGYNSHVVVMDSLSPHDAAVELLFRLVPFFTGRLILSTEEEN